MNIIDVFSAVCLLVGAGFFLAGTVALLRFPDVYTRLHALAKADNLGLGFTVLGLLPHAGSIAAGFKLVLVWLLVLVSSASVSFLIARRAHRRGVVHWQAPEQRP